MFVFSLLPIRIGHRVHEVAVTLFVVLPLLLVGCDSQTGPPGPPGPRGPEGPPGDAAVETFIVDFIVEDASQNGTVISQAYDAPEVTRGVVEQGMVTAYYREQGTWTAMPYTYGVESPDLAAVDYTVTFAYAYEEGFVELFYEVSNEAAFPSLVDREVKFVVLYGSPATFSVDWSDYSEVAQRFNLEE
jgi:hypothetical protein